MIEFDRFVAQAEIHDPRKNFALDTQVIEHRTDPLTGHPTVLRTGRKEWAWTYKSDGKLLSDIVEKSREWCFFCPEKVATATPKFPATLMPEERMRFGETWLFPNLFAQKECSAIVVLSPQHYLKLDEITPSILFDGLRAGLFYIQRVHEAKAVEYAEIGCNYLFPAGASIIHPHLQAMASYKPHYLIQSLLSNSQGYHQKNATNYWQDLIETEKQKGERYLGSIGDVEWFVPFAPLREDEVHAVVRNKSSLLEFSESDLEGMAEGISRVLKYYSDSGLATFNFAIYSGPLGEKVESFWAGLRMVSRPGVQACYANDTWYSSGLLLDGFVCEYPEEVASALRPYF